MQPGELVGPWIVIRRLGKGGMATVFLCRHHQHPDRLAAVKVMATWSADEAELARFRREHEVLGSIRHDAIVGLAPGRHTFGTDAQQRVTWMAMEYVDGAGLNRQIGRLQPAEATWVVLRLAGGIALAHAQGVYHRDIKPENVVLGSTGPKLVDFGLALTERQSRLTQLGVFAGTLAYVPNEVFLDGRPGPPEAHDIYALGVVLYECLRGERAFPLRASMPDNERLLHMRSLKRQGVGLDLGENFDPRLRDLVAAATAGDPRDRPRCVAAMAAVLETLPCEPVRVSGGPVEEPPARVISAGRVRRPPERLSNPRRRGLLRAEEERRPAPEPSERSSWDTPLAPAETDSGFHVLVPASRAESPPPRPPEEPRNDNTPAAPQVEDRVGRVAADPKASRAVPRSAVGPLESRLGTVAVPAPSPVRIEQVHRERPQPPKAEPVVEERWRWPMGLALAMASASVLAALSTLWLLRPFDAAPELSNFASTAPLEIAAPVPAVPDPVVPEPADPTPVAVVKEAEVDRRIGDPPKPKPKPPDERVRIAFITRCTSGAKVSLNGEALGTSLPDVPLTLPVRLTTKGKKDQLRGECTTGTSKMDVVISLAGPFDFEVGKTGTAIHKLH